VIDCFCHTNYYSEFVFFFSYRFFARDSEEELNRNRATIIYSKENEEIKNKK